MSAGTERAHDQVAVVGLDQKHFRNSWMGEMDCAHCGHLDANFQGVIQGKNNYVDGLGSDRTEDGTRIDGASQDAKFGASTQGADEQLRLHPVGVGDEDRYRERRRR
ncbi:MAG TPA: hypothetical protein VFE08_13355 [Candidatus Sulfotelmatobacter sp.]|nr:hypothetical protein [Candidatus Sulfotelmatobacter sp.]